MESVASTSIVVLDSSKIYETVNAQSNFVAIADKDTVLYCVSTTMFQEIIMYLMLCYMYVTKSTRFCHHLKSLIRRRMYVCYGCPFVLYALITCFKTLLGGYLIFEKKNAELEREIRHIESNRKSIFSFFYKKQYFNLIINLLLNNMR